MKKTVYVLSGGELGDPDFLRERAAAAVPAALICADGGARHLTALGMIPTLIVGDMDSLDRETRERYASMGVTMILHPRGKDQTDTELALREAFGMSPDEIWIWGALGGRIDHALANLSLLAQGMDRGVEVRLIDSWCELFLVTGRTVIEGQAGQTISLLPFTEQVTGVTLTGFQYPLTKAVMTVGHPCGVSNVLEAGRGVVEVETGCLLAVRFFRPGDFPGEGER
ncbi:MAG: thiamine diphosphokinase [Thermodesulfobacteriota bacterium]